jgi:hypothetical protein
MSSNKPKTLKPVSDRHMRSWLEAGPRAATEKQIASQARRVLALLPRAKIAKLCNQLHRKARPGRAFAAKTISTLTELLVDSIVRTVNLLEGQ